MALPIQGSASGFSVSKFPAIARRGTPPEVAAEAPKTPPITAVAEDSGSDWQQAPQGMAGQKGTGGDPLQTAAAGVRQSSSGVARAMDDLVRSLSPAGSASSDPGIDPESATIDLLQQRLALRANVAVLRATDRIKGSLLNITA